MLNRRERKLLKNNRKKNNERVTWNFLGWTVWAKNGRIEWCTACDEAFPPLRITEELQRQRRPKLK